MSSLPNSGSAAHVSLIYTDSLLPLTVSDTLCQFTSTEGYPFYPAWDLTPWTGSPLHVDDLFTLFGLLTPYVRMFPSAWPPHGYPFHPIGALTLSHHVPLYRDALSNLLGTDTPYSAAPSMNISFLDLGSVNFPVGTGNLSFLSGVDDYFFLPFIIALETKLFFYF